MKKNLRTGVTMLCAVFALAACAAGVNPSEHVPDEGGNVAGFFLGFWHGFIIWFTFFISLFTDSVQIYDVNNNGGWYDFGYLLGLSCVVGGGTASVSSR